MKKTKSTLLGVFAAILVICGIDISWAKDIDFIDLKYDFNKEVISNFELTIGDKIDKKRNIQWSLTLLQELKDIMVNVQIYAKTGDKLILLITLDENLCEIMGNPTDRTLTDILTKLFKETSNNILHPCPFSGDLYLKNFVMDPDLIPDGILEGEYMSNITIYEGKPENYLGSSSVVSRFTQ